MHLRGEKVLCPKYYSTPELYNTYGAFSTFLGAQHHGFRYYSKKSSFTKEKAGEWKAKEVDDFTYLVDFKTDKELYSFEVDFNTGIVSDVWADPRLREKYGNRKDEDPKKKSPIFKFKE